VLRAVETLYTEELVPHGRILRKLVAEDLGASTAEVDPGELLVVARRCPELRIEEGESDWSALLKDSPGILVDIYDPSDPFSADVWREAMESFSPLPEKEAFPGGRNRCARERRRPGV
jgi:hypothetical protein